MPMGLSMSISPSFSISLSLSLFLPRSQTKQSHLSAPFCHLKERIHDK